jgi:hypothetical protein
MMLQAPPARIGSPFLGVLIPAIVFAISFVLTWMLYRHFSRKPPL